MKENVVYLLGAGYSAPLGLPLMNNFLVKSRDMYFSAPEKYRHFEKVFKTIEELSIIKNYFSSDLFNIEEILSILEMKRQLQGEESVETFTNYISNVIEYYTPPIPNPTKNWPSNWGEIIFASGNWSNYGYFIATLFGLKFQSIKFDNRWVPQISLNDEKDTSYSIITLNYDLVIEIIHSYLKDNFNINHLVDLNRQTTNRDFPLAKLHGSVDTNDIVPPTWNKNVSKNISTAWKNAYQLISKANHLRIIGYSLPIADSYIKYLLKSAITSSEHLKKIDVICIDPDGSVKKRYDDFIDFNYYRFANRNILEYLAINHDIAIQDYRDSSGDAISRVLKLSALEHSHEIYMSKSPN
jgi:hypothetical protein